MCIRDSGSGDVSNTAPLEEDEAAVAMLKEAGLKVEPDSNGVVTSFVASLKEPNAELLKSLEGLPNVKQLDLTGTGIVDEGIDVLTKLPKLEQLNLSGSAITDEAMTTIGKLSNLRVFRARLTGITDKGCLLYTSPSPRDATLSRMPSSA